jgi:hypothetical protein
MTTTLDPPQIPQPDVGLAQWSAADLADLRLAKRKLESPSLTAEISSLIGQPLEKSFKLLPRYLGGQIQRITQTALLRATDVAVSTLHTDQPGPARNTLHKWMSAGSGAAGGALGLWALSVELPLSTTLILRSIADIARSEGHDLEQLEVRLACLEVFALGGRTPQDNAAESGYWLVRASLTKTMADAVAYIAEKGLITEGAPPLVRYVGAIAARFSVDISAQAAAKALPLVSALTGASINVLFMHHFQNMARGHFIVKRLEKSYGTTAVRAAYAELAI